jgi:hypothetical protein
MNLRPEKDRRLPRREFGESNSSARLRGWTICNRVAVVLLLLGLAGLAAAAKDGQYRRASNSEYQTSLATKMNVPQASAIVTSVELQDVVRLVASKPRPVFHKRFKPEPLPTESVGVIVSMQHRSPPKFLLS